LLKVKKNETYLKINMLLLPPLVCFFDWLISKEIEITYKKEERIITSVLTDNSLNSFN